MGPDSGVHRVLLTHLSTDSLSSDVCNELQMRTTTFAIAYQEKRRNPLGYKLDTTSSHFGRTIYRSCYRNMSLGKDREGPADILDSLFPTLSGARQTRNRNHLDLSGAFSVAVLVVSHRSGNLGARVAAPHPKEKPFFVAELEIGGGSHARAVSSPHYQARAAMWKGECCIH